MIHCLEACQPTMLNAEAWTDGGDRDLMEGLLAHEFTKSHHHLCGDRVDSHTQHVSSSAGGA